MISFKSRPQHSDRGNLEQLLHAKEEISSHRPELEARLCQLFGAASLHPDSPLMLHGWERPIDVEIFEIAASMISRQSRVSLLEIGAGTTWGCKDIHFGVPGLSRIIKHAFPHNSLVTVSDRSQGFDLFFFDSRGALVHRHYRDDRPPLHLSPSPLRPNGTLVPTSPPFLRLSMARDPEFASWIAEQEEQFGICISGGGSPLFIRPELDHEVEALLFGVRAVPGVDYLTLTESLLRREHRMRYDLIIGRHLLPQYLPSRLQYLKDTLPQELERCSRNSFVHFDRSYVGGDEHADLIFRHHTYL